MKKLLLVEDDRLLCTSIQDWFEHKQYQVECAHDGKDALTLLTCFDFDIVILDVVLPGMSGFELCRCFRARGGKTPILIMTGQDRLSDREEGYRSGADDYLTKPFLVEELYLRAQATLRRAGLPVDKMLPDGDFRLKPLAHFYPAYSPTV